MGEKVPGNALGFCKVMLMQLFLVDKVNSSKYIFVQKCMKKSRALGLIWIICGRVAVQTAGMHILRLETIHSNMECS